MTPLAFILILPAAFAVGWVAGGVWQAHRTRRALEARPDLERHLRFMGRVKS